MEQPDRKKHGKHILLYVLLAIASASLFGIGWWVFPDSPRISSVLTNLGLALGPVSLLGVIYEWFLFDEIRSGAREAFSGELRSCLDPIIQDMTVHTKELIDNTFILSQLHKLGIVAAYTERRLAFEGLLREIRSEEHEVSIVGTSLRGLLGEDVGDQRFRDVLREHFARTGVTKNTRPRIRILMTHPAFAYLRQDLEKFQARNEEFSIEFEIYKSVLQLRDLGARPEHIQFVKGTPTCFAVKTSRTMLLNPYPYQDMALGSFCLVVSNDTNRDEIYRSLDRSHFIWDSPNTVKLHAFSYDAMCEVFDRPLQEIMPSPQTKVVKSDDLAHTPSTQEQA